MVPDLAGPVLGETLNATLPLPVPLAPEVIVIQETFFDAVQVHDGVVLRENEPVLEAAGTESEDDEREYEQPESWLTV